MNPTQQDTLEVLSFGETIVDFLPSARCRLRDVESFTKIVGGAPGNVAMGLARLGRRVGLMCKIGDDEFGHFLKNALAAEGVDVSRVIPTREAKTGIAFVSLDTSGDRSFMFFREPSADTKLREEEISKKTFENVEMMVLGTNLLTEQPSRDAAFKALNAAREQDVFTFIDPNIRVHLWENKEEIEPCVLRALQLVDLVKINDEEIEFLGHGLSPYETFTQVLEPLGVLAMVHTKAEGGADLYLGERKIHADAFSVDVMDTTGAGDGFVAGMIAAICEHTQSLQIRDRNTLRELLSSWDDETWETILSMGCYVGSHVCTQLGATPGLPLRQDVP